jgi:hypothetical protein
MWELRKGERVMLRNEPSSRASGPMLEYPNCEGGCIHVREIKRKKSWLLVEASSEGVAARGWVRIAELRLVPETMAVGDTYGCYGDHGGGFWGGFGGNAVERWGTIRAGTLVYADEGKGEWARFAAPTRIKVRYTQGEKWGSLEDVPGLDGGWLSVNGVVALDAITLETLPPIQSLP